MRTPVHPTYFRSLLKARKFIAVRNVSFVINLKLSALYFLQISTRTKVAIIVCRHAPQLHNNFVYIKARNIEYSPQTVYLKYRKMTRSYTSNAHARLISRWNDVIGKVRWVERDGVEWIEGKNRTNVSDGGKREKGIGWWWGRGGGEEDRGEGWTRHMCAGASVCRLVRRGRRGAVARCADRGAVSGGQSVSVGWQVSRRSGLFVYDSATSEPIARANPLWVLRGWWGGGWCVSGGGGGAVAATPCRRRIRVVCWSGALTGPCALLPKMLIKEL